MPRRQPVHSGRGVKIALKALFMQPHNADPGGHRCVAVPHQGHGQKPRKKVVKVGLALYLHLPTKAQAEGHKIQNGRHQLRTGDPPEPAL